MGPLGWQETILIFVLALLLFGPKKLPELGKTVAKAIGEFRRASNELKDTWNREMSAIERENEDIRKEANEVAQAASNYVSDATGTGSYNYDYGYDSSYDYGSYGHDESSASSGATDSNNDSSSVSASAIQGADNAAASSEEQVKMEPKTPEGVVPTSSDADAQTTAR